MGCLNRSNILLPNAGVDQKKWAVVACDQYTSQPEYWEQVERYIGEAPSTLKMIYPEVYLETEDERRSAERIRNIRKQMEEYVNGNVLAERVRQGFTLSVREMSGAVRVGLMAALDLEEYDFSPGTERKVRATEGTVSSRIPPRVRIREQAMLESPHVIVLLDDPKKCVLEPLYENRRELPLLYRTELMMGGGQLTGYAVEGDLAKEVEDKLAELELASDGFFLAVGDGNHSLATAKTCWEQMKQKLTEDERKNHPARYALVEVVNLHEASLVFEPIHRVVFGGELDTIVGAFCEYLERQGTAWRLVSEPEADLTFLRGDRQLCLELSNTCGRLAVDFLQEFLDCYMRERPDLKLDYVHEAEAVRGLVEREEGCGVLLNAMKKEELFPAIRAGGVLPRKTFSIGEAREKRYYMECRSVQ